MGHPPAIDGFDRSHRATLAFAWQASLHARLDREGFSAELISTLIRSNWIRTILWTMNALILLGLAVTVLV